LESEDTVLSNVLAKRKKERIDFVGDLDNHRKKRHLDAHQQQSADEDREYETVLKERIKLVDKRIQMLESYQDYGEKLGPLKIVRYDRMAKFGKAEKIQAWLGVVSKVVAVVAAIFSLISLCVGGFTGAAAVVLLSVGLISAVISMIKLIHKKASNPKRGAASALL